MQIDFSLDDKMTFDVCHLYKTGTRIFANKTKLFCLLAFPTQKLSFGHIELASRFPLWRWRK